MVANGRDDTVDVAARTLSSTCTRRLAILECEDAKKWEGYTESLWKAALHEPGDAWTVYQACEGELPTPAAAAAYDAIVISGSHYSAYEEHKWIHKLLQLLPQYATQGTRLYGCCFGAQILARALGGSVGHNPDGNFVLTIEQIQPTAELQEVTELHAVVQQALQDSCKIADRSNSSSCRSRPAQLAAGAAKDKGSGSAAPAAAVDGSAAPPAAVDGPAVCAAAAVGSAAHAAAEGAVVDGLQELHLSCNNGCFRLIESHGDQVLTLPPGAIRLATSPTAINELWCYGPNILASQFHVEFDEPLVLEKIWQSLKDNGRLDVRQAEESRRILEAGGQQNLNMLQVIKYFLKHGVPGVTPVFAESNNVINHSKSSSSHIAGRAGSSSIGRGKSTGPASRGCSEDDSDAGNSSNSKVNSSTSSSDADVDKHQQHLYQQQQQQQHRGSAEMLSDKSSAAAAAGQGAQGLSEAAATFSPSATAQVASQDTVRAAALIPRANSSSSSHTVGSTGHMMTEKAATVAAAQVAAKDCSSNIDDSSSADPAATSALPDTTSNPAEQQQQQQQHGTTTSSSSPRLCLPPIAVHLGPTGFRLAAGSVTSSANPSANPSGANSPTAMSDHSNATAASASSAVPFAHIAYYRRQQEREEGLTESSQHLIEDSSAAFDLRMQCYNLKLETLQQLNDVAADQYSSTAEIATALCQFVTDLDTRQAAIREALAALPQLDRQLKLLESSVVQLDKRSRDLEARLGLGRSSAYDYLASTFSRAGSGVGAAAAGCLGGPAAVKQ